MKLSKEIRKLIRSHPQLRKKIWILVDLVDDSYRLEFDTKAQALRELKEMKDKAYYAGVVGPFCYVRR